MATFTLTASNGDDMTPEIMAFAENIGLNRAAPSRYSLLLVLGLYGGFKSGQLDPTKVVHEIRALEGIGPPSTLKQPIQNKYPPLKGLWHKHYLEDGVRSVALNVQKGLKRYGIPYFEQKMNEAKISGEMRYVTAGDIREISSEIVYGNYDRLSRNAELTGEWLVYAQYECRNYYLCLATHDQKCHDDLRVQIDTLCCQEFSFLSELLANA